MKKPIKYLTVPECSTICLAHPGCVGCPLKLERNRCAYYRIKRDMKKTFSEEEANKEVEV